MILLIVLLLRLFSHDEVHADLLRVVGMQQEADATDEFVEVGVSATQWGGEKMIDQTHISTDGRRG